MALRELAQSDKLRFLVLVRGFDCSPRLLSFGSLTAAVAPHARYLVPRDPSETQAGQAWQSKWRLVAASEFLALGKKHLPRTGIE
eukprot:3527909-Alexandrium_andersonii.AAC.1